MVETLRIKLARLIAPRYLLDIDYRVNRRVAESLSRMDPFEPLLKEYHGIFSDEFEHPEENLDARSQIALKMWAYQQREDPSFKYFMDWVMNTQGNETLKRAPITEARVQYGRAQIAGIVLMKREIRRIASLYEEMLAKKNPQEVDEGITVE